METFDREGGGLVFLSYSHRDYDWRVRLEVLLDPLVRNRGLRVWADEHIEIGDEWRRDFSDAVSNSRLALLLVSADYLGSKFIMDEELPALIDHGVRLAPMLIHDCLWKAEPRLAKAQWAHDPGLDGPLDHGERDARLVGICRKLEPLLLPVEERQKPTMSVSVPVAAIAKSAGARGGLFGVPELPPSYAPREELDELIGKLLGAGQGAVGLTGDADRLGLFGQGGIGKSVLATALARDDRVRTAFPDGVYWITAGEGADPVAGQLELLRLIGGPELTIANAREGRELLQKALVARRVLLIVDDVWSDPVALAFRAIDAGSRLIYTTRDEAVLTTAGAQVETVEVLPEGAARKLLAEVAHVAEAELPEMVDKIVHAAGGVPLALALIAAAVRGGISWNAALSELKRGEETFHGHPYADTFKALGVATAAVNEDLRGAYLSLAVFPRDTNIPTQAIERYWREQRDIDQERVQLDLLELAEKNLLSLHDGHVAFHDLQHDYLLLYAEDLKLLHASLIDAYKRLLFDPSDGWWQLPADEAYIADHLVEHLAQAGYRDIIAATTTDLRYLAVRIAAAGPHAVEQDLRMATKVLPHHRELARSRRWLAQNAHLFTNFANPTDLVPTMLDTLPASSRDFRALEKLAPSVCLVSQWKSGNDSSALERVLVAREGANAVAFSPDGSLLASGGLGNAIRIWNVATGQEQSRLDGHRRSVNAVVFNHDGSCLASAGDDETVRIWNVATGQEQNRLDGHSGAVNAVASYPDGSLLASAGADETVRIWNVATGQEQGRLEGNTDRVGSVAFNSDGSLLASAGDDKTVRIWNVATGQEQGQLEGHSSVVNAVAFYPDGSLLASAGGDMVVRIWNVATGQEQGQLEGHTDWVRSLAFNQDGSLLASAGDDEVVRIWNVATGQEQGQLEGHTDWVNAVAFNHDGSRLASAGDDEGVRIWNAATGPAQDRREGHTDSVDALAFNHDGSLLASAGDDKTVRIWNVATGQEQGRLEGHTDWVRSLAFNLDGLLLAGADFNKTVRIWNATTGREQGRLEGHTDLVNALAFNLDGSRLASGSRDKTVRIWNVATGQEQSRLEGHTDWVNALAFNHDGSLLASAGDDEAVLIWNIATGHKQARLDGHSSSVNAVVFSRDGSLLASAGDDETVRIWNVATGQEQGRLDGHSGSVNAVVFNYDGSLLASAGHDHTVRIWSVATPECLSTLRLDGPPNLIAWNREAVAVAFGQRVGVWHSVRSPA